MTLFEYYDSQIPDYYDAMYMNGYTPEQIRYAIHKKMVRAYEARNAAQSAETEGNGDSNVRISSEVKIR